MTTEILEAISLFSVSEYHWWYFLESYLYIGNSLFFFVFVLFFAGGFFYWQTWVNFISSCMHQVIHISSSSSSSSSSCRSASTDIPDYTYILNIWFLNTFLDNIFSRNQTVLSNTNNFIYFKSFVNTHLNVFKYCYVSRTIHLNISHFLTHI